MKARRRGAARTRAAARRSPARTTPVGEAVLYRADGPVAWVTLNNPARKNALSGTMREDLLRRILEAGSDAAVRCLVLTGAGDAFCAGGDIHAMAQMKDRGTGFDPLERLLDLGGRIVGALAALPKPTLASINGVAAGAGCNLALACDLRIASRTASLGETFARVGLHPDWGGTYFLPRLVGPMRALEMFTLAEMIPAPRAESWGLVSRVVPAARLTAETKVLAHRLAALPLRSFLSARDAARRSLTASLPAMLDFERHAQRVCWESEDSTEGIRAFLERRPPRFTGV